MTHGAQRGLPGKNRDGKSYMKEAWMLRWVGGVTDTIPDAKLGRPSKEMDGAAGRS